MFKLLWSALVGGGPSQWAILGLGAFLALGGAFGAGYAVASQGAIKTVATVAAKAAKAQEKHDTEQHNAASTKSASVKAEDKKHDAKVAPIYQDIARATPQNSCEVSVDVLKDLNAAGQY